MSGEISVCLKALSAQLMGYEGDDGFVEGVFTELLGFRSSTTKMRTAHLMNDLAQATLQRLPEHEGDLIARFIRHDRVGRDEDKGEDNSDATLRADVRLGESYARVIPEGAFHPAELSALREAISSLINHDRRVFKAGDKMTSPVATHWGLLGAEGFRRFGVGVYLASLLGEPVRAELNKMLEDDQDPVSRALAPLLACEPHLKETRLTRRPLTPFDQALSGGLSNLLKHRAAKTTRLRYFAFGATLGLVLKFYGSGSVGGVPQLIALPSESELSGGGRKLRSQAVQSLAWSLTNWEREVAAHLVRSGRWEALLNSDEQKQDKLKVHEELAPEEAALKALDELKRRPSPKKSEKKDRVVSIYWPEAFINSIGAQIGLIGPNNQGGWSKYLTLTPELLEVLMLMVLDPGGQPISWRALWERLSSNFGVMIGVNPDDEAQRLEGGGVAFMSLEDMHVNSEIFLEYAIERGVARRLPDSGAEAGVSLR